MTTALSPRARVWILVLLAGGGVVLVLLWGFLHKHVPQAPAVEEGLHRPEPVAAPVEETTREKPRAAEIGLTQPVPELAKAKGPIPPPIPAPPTEAKAETSLVDDKLAKRMRGMLNFVSGVVSTSTGATTTK